MSYFKFPYKLRTDNSDGITRYFVSFKDGADAVRETEVSRPVYLEFQRCIRIERNQIRRDERHGDDSDLSEEQTYTNMKNPPKSLEDTVFDRMRNERLRQAISELTETQRRRFVLYHEFGLNYGQIAEMEGCHFTTARESVKQAKNNIKNNFKSTP